jgi:hypothetical protein|nr:hypothetical protein [uncultured bacterium]
MIVSFDRVACPVFDDACRQKYGIFTYKAIWNK